MAKYNYPKLKVPHCKHCQNYHEYTGNCLIRLMSNGLKKSAKAFGSRTCSSFKVLEKYKDLYTEELKNDKH